ncbi:MAG TPA: hypothetical protein VM942_08900 [Acidimicrobiales bacterium]|nr:hypothetical protein [Acidimicrobiales bacterium]
MIPTELFEAERSDCWACGGTGRLFEPCPERLLQLTWSGVTTKPERALIEGLKGRAEHLHAEYPLQGHSCDILLPFRRIVVEHDGEYAHRVNKGGRDHLTADRKNTEAIVAAGFVVIRMRDRKLLPLGATGAVDVFPPRDYRPDRTQGPAMTAAMVALSLTSSLYRQIGSFCNRRENPNLVAPFSDTGRSRRRLAIRPCGSAS